MFSACKYLTAECWAPTCLEMTLQPFPDRKASVAAHQRSLLFIIGVVSTSTHTQMNLNDGPSSQQRIKRLKNTAFRIKTLCSQPTAHLVYLRKHVHQKNRHSKVYVHQHFNRIKQENIDYSSSHFSGLTPF